LRPGPYPPVEQRVALVYSLESTARRRGSRNLHLEDAPTRGRLQCPAKPIWKRLPGRDRHRQTQQSGSREPAHMTALVGVVNPRLARLLDLVEGLVHQQDVAGQPRRRLHLLVEIQQNVVDALDGLALMVVEAEQLRLNAGLSRRRNRGDVARLDSTGTASGCASVPRARAAIARAACR